MNSAELWLLVALTVGIAGYMVVRQSDRGPLPFIAAYLAFMGVGPVINHLMGEPVYAGVIESHIPAATLGYLVAVLGLLIANSIKLKGRGSPYSASRESDWAHRYGVIISSALLISASYALFTIVSKGPSILGVNKLIAVAAAGSFHYPYLLFQIILASCYLLIRGRSLPLRIFWFNIGIYVAYCLLTNERDFILVLVGIAVQSQSRKLQSRLLLVVGSAAAAAILGTFLFVSRGGDTGGSLVASVLGQSSLLFVDTQVLDYVPMYEGYSLGSTYWDSLLAAVGLGFWGNEAGLSQWLIDIYAPGSPSGYGFSLIAEITLNFSQWAILPVFILLGLAVRAASNNAGSSPFSAFLSTFFIVFISYMLRSDSLGLFSGVVYAVLFFAAISMATMASKGVTSDEAARRR